MRAVAAASLLALGVYAAPEGCPNVLRAPYMDEESPFGMPLAPGDWDFAHSACWAHNYLLCGGEKQSPMALDFRHEDASCRVQVDGSAGALGDLASYKVVSGNPEVKVSKYMRSVMAKGNFGTLTLKDATGHDVTYTADQIHVTADSAHSINGTHHSAELMIIHKPNVVDGRSVIVSMMFEEGEERNALLDQMGLNADRSTGAMAWSSPMSLDLTSAVAPTLAGDAYFYEGSMPVPPCSESVAYFVLATPVRAHRTQIAKIEDILRNHAGGTSKRPPVARQPEGGTTCRKIQLNTVQLGTHSGESACAAVVDAEKERSAACWESSCGRSPVNIVTADAAMAGASVAAASLMHYKPTSHVTVTSNMYTIDATVPHGGNFGYLMIEGRKFEATKIMIKPMSAHTINGERFAGELMIEHVMFGDSIGGDHHSQGHDDSSAHRRLETEGAEHAVVHTSDDHEGGHGGSHPPGKRTVVVSVPLKVGSESALLRHLGLGLVPHAGAIRDNHAYSVHDSIDLESGLSSVMSYDWFWYSGSALHGHECSDFGVRWMIFETPLEVSLEQINSLNLPVSGVDSSPTPNSISSALVYKSSMPSHAAEKGDGDCSANDVWSYDHPSCWGNAVTMCASGMRQSPINIETAAITNQGDANFLSRTSWKPVAGLRIESDGNGVQVHNKQLGYVTIIGQSGLPDFYQITDLGLKMPSEHFIDGKQYAAELQVVHKKQLTVGHLDDEDIIITSFVFEVGLDNSTLLKQLNVGGHMPTAHTFTEIPTPVDLMWALGKALDGPFYTYPGSMTTPGCAETVKWFVFETPQKMSAEQYSAFNAAYSTNNRPVQPLNGRELAKNSLEEGDEVDYRFFLGRDTVRNRREPPAALIIVPIVATVILMTVVASGMWVREETSRKKEQAGGLQTVRTVIGRPQTAYDPM